MAARARSESPWFGEGSSESSSGYALYSSAASRKRAEQDSILLANRIRLLRSEEAKTRKKIAETEKKTKEIVELQRRSEERRAAQEAEQVRREQEEAELRARQQQERAAQQRKLHDGARKIMEQRIGVSHEVRLERQEHLLAIEEQRQMDAAIAVAKADRVRAAAAAATRSRARSEGAKHEAAQSLHRERQARDEDVANARLKEIERMEREEAALVSRLQQSQERHRAAFLRLEDALRGPGSGGQPLALTSGLGSAPRSGCATPLSFDGWRHPGTPSSGSASGGAPPGAPALGSGGGGGIPGAARPPRPRGTASGPSLHAAAAAAPGASASRPQSGSRTAPRRQTAPSSRKPPIGGAHPPRSTSSCSTDTGGGASGADGGIARSGQSTPSSSAAPQITYTTCDGTNIDLTEEEDLDLASILNA